MNVIETLERVQNEAVARSEGDDDYVRLVQICEKATCLDGTVQELGARAAIAAMAEVWLGQVGGDAVSADNALHYDVVHTIGELEQFLEEAVDQTKTGRPFKLGSVEAVEAKADDDRVVARYVKEEEARPRGRIVHVGESYWDVTSVIDSLERGEVLSLRDHSYSTDWIVDDYSDHDGPHYVEVREQALDYIGATEDEVAAN